MHRDRFVDSFKRWHRYLYYFSIRIFFKAFFRVATHTKTHPFWCMNEIYYPCNLYTFHCLLNCQPPSFLLSTFFIQFIRQARLCVSQSQLPGWIFHCQGSSGGMEKALKHTLFMIAMADVGTIFEYIFFVRWCDIVKRAHFSFVAQTSRSIGDKLCVERVNLMSLIIYSCIWKIKKNISSQRVNELWLNDENEEHEVVTETSSADNLWFDLLCRFLCD